MDLIPLDHPSIKEDLFCFLTESPTQELRRSMRRLHDVRQVRQKFSKSDLLQTVAVGSVCLAAIAACFILVI